MSTLPRKLGGSLASGSALGLQILGTLFHAVGLLFKASGLFLEGARGALAVGRLLGNRLAVRDPLAQLRSALAQALRSLCQALLALCHPVGLLGIAGTRGGAHRSAGCRRFCC